MLNEEIKSVLVETGYEPYVPQDALPPSPDVSPMHVLQTNIRAVEEADLVVTVLDKPGFGVAFELGFARALGKRVVLFRSDRQDYLGKILEGVWTEAAEADRAATLDELRMKLQAGGGS